MTQGFKISIKKFFAVMLLFFPSYAWFNLFDMQLYFFIQSVSENLFWIYLGKLLFYIAIAIGAIIGSILIIKLKRRRFLKFWILFGIIFTLSFAFFQDLTFFLFMGILAGFSFGLGFPTTMACIAESTIIEERARISGAAIFVTFVTVILSISTVNALQLGLMGYIFVNTGIRAISYFALLLEPCEKIVCRERSWKSVWKTRGFKSYFVAWLMVNLAGVLFIFFEIPMDILSESILNLGEVFLFLGVIASALISGFVADYLGRKKAIIFGVCTLGISYELFSISTSPTTFFINRTIYGAAWGIIMVCYGLTVIGDFAVTCSKEKFYAVCVIVPLLFFPISQIFSEVYTLPVSTSIISAILGITLFISAIPLVYAPETLSTDIIDRRELKKHLARAREIQKKLEKK